jgi:hypothetical protein
MARGGSGGSAALSFTRVREDVIGVIREINDEISLVCFEPSKNLPDTIDPDAYSPAEIKRFKQMHDGEDVQLFFVTRAQLDVASKSKDPVTLLSNHKKTRRYQLLHPSVPNLFNDVSLESIRREGTYFKDFFVEDREALLKGEVDPDRIVAFDGYDYTLWKPGEDHPANRVFGFDSTYGIDSGNFDLDKARAILEAHPWVISVDKKEASHTTAWTSEVFFDMKIPDETYMKMWEFAKADKRAIDIHRQPTLGAHAIYDMMILPVKAKSPDADVDPAWLAQFSPLEFDPLGLRAARKGPEPYDEDEERY